MVFFVVLVSAVTQGWTLRLLARKLGLGEEREPAPPVTLEITSLRDVDADIVEYTVGDQSRVAGRRLNQLALPEGVVVAMIARGGTLIPPRGSTQILTGDHVFVVLQPGVRPLVNRVFSRDPAEAEEIVTRVEFPLLASATVEDLKDFYGIRLEAPPDRTLARLLEEHARPSPLTEGYRIVIGGIILRVLEIGENGIERVGLEIAVRREVESEPPPVEF